MGNVKQIEIKNQTYYFYSDIINIEEFDSNLLKIVQRHWYLLYLQLEKLMIENIYIVNPLYLIIGKVDGHIDCNSVEEKNENKEVFKKVHRTLEKDEMKLKQ